MHEKVPPEKHWHIVTETIATFIVHRRGTEAQGDLQSALRRGQQNYICSYFVLERLKLLLIPIS